MAPGAAAVCQHLETEHGVDFESRLFRSDPWIKSIIVEGQHALFGLYSPDFRPTHEKAQGRSGYQVLSALDYLGTEIKMVEIGRGHKNRREARYCARCGTELAAGRGRLETPL